MILDLIIILIVALFTYLGYRQGLVKAAIKILTFFIALFISISLYKTAANIIINNTQIDETITNKIVSRVLTNNVAQKAEILPDAIIASGEKTITQIAQTFTEKLIYIGTFILLFIVIKIVLMLVNVLADIITKLPIIKQFDKTGGTIYGFIKGLLIVMVIFTVISMTSFLLSQQYLDMINNSIIGSYLYNHNWLIGLVK